MAKFLSRTSILATLPSSMVKKIILQRKADAIMSSFLSQIAVASSWRDGEVAVAGAGPAVQAAQRGGAGARLLPAGAQAGGQDTPAHSG